MSLLVDTIHALGDAAEEGAKRTKPLPSDADAMMKKMMDAGKPTKKEKDVVAAEPATTERATTKTRSKYKTAPRQSLEEQLQEVWKAGDKEGAAAKCQELMRAFNEGYEPTTDYGRVLYVYALAKELKQVMVGMETP